MFAVTDEDADRLRAAAGDDKVMEVIEEIEERWDRPNLAETDKAWDPMHRALTDGILEFGNGEYPLSHVILGGEELCRGEDYIAILKTPAQVRDIAAAIAQIDGDAMGARYSSTVPADYDPNYGEEDRDYTVGWFEGVRDLYGSAAKSGRWVLFTVDQ